MSEQAAKAACDQTRQNDPMLEIGLGTELAEQA